MIKLSFKDVEAIERILNSGKKVEIAVYNNKLILWSRKDKKIYERPTA